jgi:hypothetical protein
MYSKARLFKLTILLGSALLLTLAAAPADMTTAHTSNGTIVTKININGRDVETPLVDGTTQTAGFLAASEDQIANTKALDFGFSTYLGVTDPDTVFVFQGQGQIPNSALTITRTSAHLALTTPDSFFLIRCVISTITGDYTCAPTDPLTFDLTWVVNNFGSDTQTTKRTLIFGPTTMKFNAEFTSLTAPMNGTMSGTWGEITFADMAGSLVDTGSKTFIREITVKTNP